jgi:rhodanese-related sulfurtransferase
LSGKCAAGFAQSLILNPDFYWTLLAKLRRIRHRKMNRNTHVADFKNITVAELVKILQQDNLKLIDVRTDAEISHGKIPQGMALPLHLLPLRLNELDKGAATVFYCQMGGRSAQAAAFAVANGFSDVYNLQGGITAWAHADLPVS